MILTACETGTPMVTSTEELLGTTSVLLSLGVTTVMAPVVPVPDGTLDRFVLDLHQGLIDGTPARHAYRIARCNAAESQDVLAAVTAHCFLPMGNQ